MNRIASMLAALMLPCALVAQVPATLGYQARLTATNGTPVNGAQTITFALYDVASGGAALWTETQAVTVSNGDLSVSLGEATPIPEAIFGRRLYLGIQVGVDPEMTPRPKFNAAPYSVKARGVLQNTIYVPASGTPVENGNALKAAAVALQPNGAIVLDAGEFDLGSDNISLPNRATLRGQGRYSSWVYSVNDLYTVRMNGFQTQLKNLRVANFVPPTVGASTATVLIADGANGAQIQDANIIASQVSTAAADGGRYAIVVRDADAVRIFNSEVGAGNAGQDVAAIAAVSPSSASTGLTIDTVNITANGNGNTAIGLSIADHTSVVLRDVRAFAGGTATSITGLLANRASLRIENSVLQPTGGIATTTHRAVWQLDSSLDLRNTQLNISNVTGVAAYGLDGLYTPPGNPREVQFAGSQLQNIGSAAEQRVGMRLAGVRLISRDSSIEVVSTGGAPTAMVGLLVLPDGSGAASAFFSLRNTSVDVRHGSASDLGAAIVTEKTNISLYQCRIFATDDGIEAGQSGNAANVNGAVTVVGGLVYAGGATTGQRSSIRKHQNWSVVSRGVDYEETFLAEPGGSLNCFATTRSSGGDSFVAAGCPLP